MGHVSRKADQVIPADLQDGVGNRSLTMATLEERSKDNASLSRTAALLSKCFKIGEVTENVAKGLKSVFPEAYMLRYADHQK